MLKSIDFVRGKSRGIVSGGTKATPPAPVILGRDAQSVSRILLQRVSNLVNKFALLLHKCWLREDSLDKPKNDWCLGRGLSVFCQFFKYPSPDAKALPSPSRGEGSGLPRPWCDKILGTGPSVTGGRGANFVRLLRCARNDAATNGEGWLRSWCDKILGTGPSMTGGRDANSFGRSMIEMLGVLAIIAVLSVGGIAGYSKAMMKYKINKMTEEYTILMTGLMEYQESLFKTYANNDNRFLAQFIIDAKLVPETWKFVNKQFITDSLGNKINAYVDTAASGTKFTSDIYIVPSGVNKDSEYAYQLCMALSHEVVYPLAANMGFTELFIRNDAITNSNGFMVYTKSCYGSGFNEVKCLSDMTLSEISQICKSCVKKDSCYVGMSWR